ncbi:MAG: hypothetical protein K6G37_00105 [Bacilli bacterium]|nr:hypothetical protein [Bacilli bacterium]
MKEAIGGTWLFQIVIVFVFLFAGYICLSINHSKAFAVKDDIIEAIERNNGIDFTVKSGDKTTKEIVERLKTASYRTGGNCSRLYKNNDDRNQGVWYGYSRDGVRQDGDNAISTYCVREIDVSNKYSELPRMVYYQVVVFYQLDLPVLNSIMSFKVSGDTKLIYGNR